MLRLDVMDYNTNKIVRECAMGGNTNTAKESHSA